jgi:hypothetical protein
MRFQNFIGHLELAGTAKQIFLVQVVAVSAIQITDCADGLDHRVISATGAGLRRPWG